MLGGVAAYPAQSGSGPERVVLCAVRSRPEEEPDPLLEELAELAATAGAQVVGWVVQRRSHPDPVTYLGEGKAEELREYCHANEVTAVVCDDELTPLQARRLSDLLEVKVLDRTQLILDIFAQRARSREGKLQVELAQLRYLLPRLTGQGAQLSRLGGGIGTRGPGETKLETDRRRIRHRLAELRRELEEVRRHRRRQRQSRQARLTPVVALVGYTNAGKSTLLNALTGSEVSAADRLFETLDPTIRAAQLPSGGQVLLVDTVGFIRKLPHDLVAAFRATLEEVAEADALVHVLDVSEPGVEERAAAVEGVLAQLGAAEKPRLTALNKVDRLPPSEVERWRHRWAPSVAISARTGQGLDRLLAEVARLLPEPQVVRTYEIPFDQSGAVAWLHEHGRVLEASYTEAGVVVTATLRASLAGQLEAYLRKR